MAKKKYQFKLTGVDASIGPLDPRVSRVLKAANDLSIGHSGNIGFLHSTFCQTPLPCRQPSLDVRCWQKNNGHSSLMINAGHAYDPINEEWLELPIPSGTKARLSLIYLSTIAVKTKSPVIQLGGSMTSFLRTILRRRPNSHDMAQFQTQMSALGAATIRLATDNRQTNSQIVSEFDLMWFKRKKRRVLWPSEFRLSAEYWSSLKDKAVPLDLEAIAAISHSALAIDIYLWLTHRLRRIVEPYTVYWAVLWKQFGEGYNRLRDFRRKFLHALRYATAVYPGAIVEELISDKGVSSGIKLYRSPPPIPLHK